MKYADICFRISFHLTNVDDFSQDFGRALQLDALHNSHPVDVPVYKAAEVDEIFDHISYCKGVCRRYLQREFVTYFDAIPRDQLFAC